MDLADQVLEEALELLDRAVGGGQELGRVEAPRLEPADVVELGDQLAAEALDLAARGDRVAGLEAQPDPVGVAEDARRRSSRCGRAAAATGTGTPFRAVSRSFAQARVAALEALPRAQLGDLADGSARRAASTASILT